MKRSLGFLVLAALTWGGAGAARAQAVKPRFVLILDTSSSMVENPSSTETYGDGSVGHEGCDLDNSAAAGRYAYDDSRLYQAKGAIADTIAAFGSAEFALGRFTGVNLGQACTVTNDCPKDGNGTVWSGVTCVSGACMYTAGHYSCTSCPARCKTPFDNLMTYRSTACRGSGTCAYPACKAGEVLVPFPGAGGSNYAEMFGWMNGTEAVPPYAGANPDPELHADLGTPLASSMDSIREWLTTAASTTGPNAGPLQSGHMFADSRASCRPYSVILLTDGDESCENRDVAPPAAATRLRQTCTNGGTWDATDSRCEINGDPKGTSSVNVYVIGFGVSSAQRTRLNAIAAAGGTSTAYAATNRAELTASLADIVARSLPRAVCDCDSSCDDEAAAFPDKGLTCSVGVGRCKRTGVYSCDSGGDGTVCSSTPASTCPATPLTPGSPVMEQCGVAPGACNAPTPEDCADDDCDGQVDEGLSCACTPEVCNGRDDDCNNVIDDLPDGTCGLNIGICRPGISRCVSNGMGGANLVCEGGTGPRTEDCNNADDNCNGIVDDVASRVCFPTGFMGCTYNPTTRSYECRGQCQPGLQACLNGSWDQSACDGAITPLAEVPCDHRDNNCDGLTDENDPTPNDQCYPAGVVGCSLAGGMWTCVGECRTGRSACDATLGVPACMNAVIPATEVCDGRDNDCDGLTDEGFDVGATCDNGVQGPCLKMGTKVCNSVGTGTTCNVGSSVPGDEVCDGDDNDCDGMTDEAPLPGVGAPCGSPVGECRQGTTMCIGGALVCTSVGPTDEVCDGLDNNCNGSIDENLPGAGEECRPPTVPDGPLQGECRPGQRVCVGQRGWECQGGMGPLPEICDGKDNDCDGIIDNGAPCAAGATCMTGECLPACKLEETQRCPPDRLCRDGYCVRKACADNPCAVGQICNAAGMCADPCADVTCPSGTTCEGGLCHDCHTRQNCAAGEVCRVHECEKDPCYQVNCSAGAYCREGSCVKACPTSCPAGQRCQEGDCVADKCANVTCAGTDYCDLADGICKPSGCVGVQCMIGMVCLKQSGECEVDPCQVTRCPYGDTCRVLPDGTAQCFFDPSIPGAVKTFSASGGSCACRLGEPGGGSPDGGWLFMMVVAGWLVRWRAGRNARRGAGR
jgi:hypothetical protein